MDTAPSSPPAGATESTPALETDTPLTGTGEKAAPRRNYARKPKVKQDALHQLTKQQKTDDITAYTTAFVPGLYNVKNPAGEFVVKESNVDVWRHASQAKVKAKKDAIEAEREEARTARAEGEASPEPENPLNNILIIHPGSRYLRLGRASDFYPHEVPNCIARPASAPGTSKAPVLGQKRDAEAMDENITHLRDYLRNRLRANKLTTDWKEGQRVVTANSKVNGEPIPEHNDPYRIEWTELEGRKFVVGTDALRLQTTEGFQVRWPILQRHFNTRDWASPQLLLDDLTLIWQESLRTELNILPKDYKNYSVVLIIPDHGDRGYVQELTNIILNVMEFKEIAVHQESYCAIFSAGMSSACVVDIGAQETSVTCVEDGLVNPDTRLMLSYGGDDVTAALAQLLERSSFPYKNLDLSRVQDWSMMDQLKIRICTLEEHLVANTPWEFYVVAEGQGLEGRTKKYALRTYDENVLAPLCVFDTRMIDFDTKKGEQFRAHNPDVQDLIKSTYDEPTGAMKACTTHLHPSRSDMKEETPAGAMTPSENTTPTKAAATGTPGISPTPVPSATPAEKGTFNLTPSTPLAQGLPTLGAPSATATPTLTPAPDGGDGTTTEEASYDIVHEAARTPLDGAIAASIAQSASENKVKAASSSILLVGGGSALKGLGPFIAERLPPLLRQRGFPITEVQIVPPPRNLNPKFVSWKGASVMCNLDSLSDMWIRADEYREVGARALKDRYTFF